MLSQEVGEFKVSQGYLASTSWNKAMEEEEEKEEENEEKVKEEKGERKQ